MKLRYKHQKFQADAAEAVCDVFAGQPYQTLSYRIDPGKKKGFEEHMDIEHVGFKNQPIAGFLDDRNILANINAIQRKYQLPPSAKLEGRYNLTIEMETGVGKTYTYIKTMYELNKRYGWSKFIVIVPSIAIREGVNKTFEITQDHFAEDYSKKIRFFIYNSSNLDNIESFASDSNIHVMIINSQAFNATGKDARRIYMEQDNFRSRKPIDVIAATNPILIIDEPQSVEGEKTKERLKEFKPLFTLRYSATHKEMYNLVYRLDAMDAYNQKLVKRIRVKGISYSGSTATEGYVYLQRIECAPHKLPIAIIEHDIKRKDKISKTTSRLSLKDNLYAISDGLDEYKDRYVITDINAADATVSFENGIVLHISDAIGMINEEQLRRIQIRETIYAHIEREQTLFKQGIKVLSLFFIDEVAKYKQYNEANQAYNGVYADIFEEEYADAIERLKSRFSSEYKSYLEKWQASATHSGYFSIDKKKGRMIDGQIEARSSESKDVDAFDLIMKNKERLLDFKESVRFIFSHSALREGWDNPNVFQICTLKQSGSDTRRRQEVGRGLRLSVNQHGERMDSTVLENEVHSVNVLTVIASESYQKFATALQTELADSVYSRPKKINEELFKNRTVYDRNGNSMLIDANTARAVYNNLIRQDYVDDNGNLTDKYIEDEKAGSVAVAEAVKDFKDDIIQILQSVYKAIPLENAGNTAVTLTVDKDKLKKADFLALWGKINTKSAYTVEFDTGELIRNAIECLNRELNVQQIYIAVESGVLADIKSKEQLEQGIAFVKNEQEHYSTQVAPSEKARYDLIGRITAETELTRKTIAKILQGIKTETFEMFKQNPEDFIVKSSNIINSQKGTLVVEHITYNKLSETYNQSIFTDPVMKGILGHNAIQTDKHLYDYLLYDSSRERDFAQNLDASKEVSIYVKLPNGFFINTPVGKYNPDWAIVFHKDTVKHIYFIAETKGTLSSLQLRDIENAKIECARRHLQAISSDNVKYDVVRDYNDLMNLVML